MAATQSLDTLTAELALKYKPLAVEILKEIIRIPADHVAKDPQCGLSNHELPRLEYLKKRIVEIKAVDKPEDVYYDEMGNLVWHVSDPADGIDIDKKKVVYLDGHTDTVKALRDAWHSRIGAGIDPYNGLTDSAQISEEGLRRELGFLPPRDEWDHLVFGRGSADQLAGVTSQVIATKILLELRPAGALRGAIVRSVGTVAEEDNDGGAPKYICKYVLPGAKPNVIPDAVIYTEGTGDSRTTAMGIYRGQRGRMQIEVEVIGKSCHGSMPWEGLNPLEAGSRIIAEAAARYEARIGFLDDTFLGHGTRTASWSTLATPSDCAVPEKFTFRFDRRITIGETPDSAVADIDTLQSVAAARAAGFVVKVAAPLYTDATWKGFRLNNPQIYNAWVTPEAHPAIQAAVATYKAVVGPHAAKTKGSLTPAEPRVSRWIFSTDGVGFIVPSQSVGPEEGKTIRVPVEKGWINDGQFAHPPMFGFGAGFEQNTHKLGECVDARDLVHAIAFIARFPSMLVAVAK
jgi:putative selenium metabolism hydrolase